MIKVNLSSFNVPQTKKRKKSKVKRTLLFILIVLLAINISSVIVIKADNNKDVETELNNNILAQLGALNLNELEQLVSQYGQDSKLWGSFTFYDKVVSIISGEFAGGGETFFQALFAVLIGQVVLLLPSLVTIAVVSILCGVITNFKSSGSFSTNTSEIIFFACFSIVIIIILIGVWTLIDVTKTTIDSIKLQMNIVLPILITLITAMGGSVSATVYQPAIALLSGGVIEVISLIVIPLFIFSVIFAIVSNLSSNVRINKMSEFFRNANSWIIGITFTVFTAFLTVQGLTASTIDGVSVRAAKYAIKNYVPIVGSYLGDGFDLILASTTLIKNAIGVAGLLLLVGTILLPIAQILCYMWGLKLVSAAIEPLCDARIVKFTSSVADSIKVLFASLLAIGMMFLIIIMLIIFTCNALY